MIRCVSVSLVVKWRARVHRIRPPWLEKRTYHHWLEYCYYTSVKGTISSNQILNASTLDNHLHKTIFSQTKEQNAFYTQSNLGIA